uniref:Uncharacterized protein n=1 Tax=Oryza glumipatula TaxID=40148 RepID=A0A0D9Z4G1_9ORYZ
MGRHAVCPHRVDNTGLSRRIFAGPVPRRRRVFEGRSGGSQREGGRCLETKRRRGALEAELWLVILKAFRWLPPPMHVATPVPPSPPPAPGLCSTLASAPPAHARAHMVFVAITTYPGGKDLDAGVLDVPAELGDGPAGAAKLVRVVDDVVEVGGGGGKGIAMCVGAAGAVVTP